MTRFCMALWFLLLFVPQELEACKCKAGVVVSNDAQLAEYLTRMPVAFIGVAKAVLPERTASFEVLWSYNGVTTRRVEVASGSDNCSYPFQPGQVYVVYSRGPANSQFTVSKCSRTGLFNERLEDVVLLSRRPSLLLQPDSAGRRR
jgi:hypothetical protein